MNNENKSIKNITTTVKNFCGINVTPGIKCSVGKELQLPDIRLDVGDKLSINITESKIQQYYDDLITEMQYWGIKEDRAFQITRDIIINSITHNLMPWDVIWMLL